MYANRSRRLLGRISALFPCLRLNDASGIASARNPEKWLKTAARMLVARFAHMTFCI